MIGMRERVLEPRVRVAERVAFRPLKFRSNLV